MEDSPELKEFWGWNSDNYFSSHIAKVQENQPLQEPTPQRLIFFVCKPLVFSHLERRPMDRDGAITQGTIWQTGQRTGKSRTVSVQMKPVCSRAPIFAKSRKTGVPLPIQKRPDSTALIVPNMTHYFIRC